jgi:hypothetical protein
MWVIRWWSRKWLAFLRGSYGHTVWGSLLNRRFAGKKTANVWEGGPEYEKKTFWSILPVTSLYRCGLNHLVDGLHNSLDLSILWSLNWGDFEQVNAQLLRVGFKLQSIECWTTVCPKDVRNSMLGRDALYNCCRSSSRCVSSMVNFRITRVVVND